MTEDPYWSEVDRQPKEITDQGAQELNYLLSVLRGKRQSTERFKTRVKYLSIGIGIIVGVTETWDWITGFFRH